MKKQIIELVFVVLVFSACKQIDKLTQFDLEYDRTFVIPLNSDLDLPMDIPIPDVETNAETSFAINDTRKDNVEEIRLTSLDFTILSPEGADFSFLKSVNVYMSAQNLPELLVAWKNNITETADTLFLETTDADLKEYVKQETFELRFNTIVDELLTDDHEINMHAVFFVDAKVLGQ